MGCGGSIGFWRVIYGSNGGFEGLYKDVTSHNGKSNEKGHEKRKWKCGFFAVII